MKQFLKIIAISILLTVIGCKKDSNNPASPPSSQPTGNIILAPETKQIEKDDGFSSVKVDSVNLIFSFNSNSSLPSIKVGDILIGALGGGYLRKVVSESSSGNTITVTTTNASLDEAFSKIVMDTTVSFNPNLQKLNRFSINKILQSKEGDLNYSVNSEVPTFSVNKTTGEMNFIFPGLTFSLESQDESASFNLQIDTVSIKISISSHQKINFVGSSKSFSLIYQVSCTESFKNVSMSLVGKIKGQFPDDKHDNLIPTDVFLGTIPIPPVWLGFYFNIASAIEGDFQMGAGTKFINSTSITSSYDVGATFTNGSWKPVWQPSLSGNSDVSFTPVANISGEADIFIKPKLSCKLCSVAGPELFIKGYLYGKVSSPPLDASLGFGLSGGLGFDVSIFSLKLAKFEAELVIKEWPFWQKTFTNLPIAPVLTSPLNGSQNQSLNPTLSWNASSGATSYTLQVATDNTFANYIYNQSGLKDTNNKISGLNNLTKYYWHVSASNDNGTSVYSDVWNFTTVTSNGGGIALPFSDDFTQGKKVDWDVEGTDWTFSNGKAICNIPNTYVVEYMDVGNTSWVNYTFETDVMGTAGTDKMIGFRFQDIKNYYELHLIGPIQYHDIEFSKVVNGERTILFHKNNYTVLNNTNYHIKVVISGNEYKIYINNNLEVDVTDNTFSNGGIALINSSGGYAPNNLEFDNVIVY